MFVFGKTNKYSELATRQSAGAQNKTVSTLMCRSALDPPIES